MSLPVDLKAHVHMFADTRNCS